MEGHPVEGWWHLTVTDRDADTSERQRKDEGAAVAARRAVEEGLVITTHGGQRTLELGNKGDRSADQLAFDADSVPPAPSRGRAQAARQRLESLRQRKDAR